MAVKSVFDIKCFKDVKFWVEPENIFQNIIPPRVPAKALACIYVTVFYTLYGSGLLAHGGGGGGGDVQQPENPGPKPKKCLFYQIRNY